MPHHLKSIILILLLGATGQCAAQYKVTHMETPFNTPGSETGALRLGDTVLAYSSMPPKIVKGSTFDYSTAVMQIYQSRIAKNGKMGRPKPCRWGLNSKKDHTGNLTMDPVSHDLYFTRGDVETLRCDIWYARKLKRGWSKPIKLRGAVNNKQYTSTHPAVGRLNDSTALLYFVSDRPGGMGGMDIWYAQVRDGAATEPVNLGPQVNSADDELTPFYDQRNGILYFSSNREGGKGGHDIYCAVGSRNTWQPAEPVCHCLNSEQNDLYFTISDYDAASGFPIGGYLSSNRRDSYFLSDSMCCNDLYKWSVDSSLWGVAKDTLPDIMTSSPNSEFRFSNFPLALYFHNDDPDPRSRDSLTTVDYADCQLRYALMRSTYLAHQHTAADSALMTEFFDSCVVVHYDLLLEMLEQLRQQLAEGRRATLTVSGYASPLHTDDYNYILSQRRIASLVNMIRAWRGGALADALADGRLCIVQQPMGAEKINTQHSSPNTQSDPVYSLSAARARRIEITSCEIF